eukprot:1753003-Pleurochrysis_carterae.AAC.1
MGPSPSPIRLPAQQTLFALPRFHQHSLSLYTASFTPVYLRLLPCIRFTPSPDYPPSRLAHFRIIWRSVLCTEASARLQSRNSAALTAATRIHKAAKSYGQAIAGQGTYPLHGYVSTL